MAEDNQTSKQEPDITGRQIAFASEMESLGAFKHFASPYEMLKYCCKVNALLGKYQIV